MTKLKSSSRFLLSEGALWHVNVLNQLPISDKGYPFFRYTCFKKLGSS